MKRQLAIGFIIFILTAGAVPAQQEKPDIDVSIEPSSISPGGEGTLIARFTIPDSMYMALQEQFFFVGFTDKVEGIEEGLVRYPGGTVKNGLTIYTGEVVLKRPFTLSEDFSPGSYEWDVTAAYQMCDENGICFIPQREKQTVTMTVAPGSSAGTIETAGPSSFSFLKLLQFILFAFVGGIILNIMPCVLPLLSVRALSLVNQGQQDRRKIFAGSMAYTGGILVSFFIIAAIVTVLKFSGELVGWGFQFQNPGFVIVLTSVIFVFALSMFDVFVIQPPGMGVAAKATGKGGYAGSFFTGVFAVLVATPCTAPFMGTALGFAFSQPPAIIFLIFSFVGLGLALPFIILGIWPKFIQKIPKPGNWMNIFKEIMGFLLIGTAIYLLITLNRQLSSENFIRLLIFLGLLAFASWAYGRFARPGSPKLRQWIAVGMAVAVITLGAVFVVRTGPPGGDDIAADRSGEVYINEDWMEFDPERIASYREQGEPVFISFHAVWCTNCKVNKAAVLSSKTVLDSFDAHGVRLFHADFTHNDQTIARWIKNFGKAGVPVYALFVPGREEAVLFPELLSKGMIINALEQNL